MSSRHLHQNTGKGYWLDLGSECKLVELHRDKTGLFGQPMLCSMQQLADAALLADQGDEAALKKLIAPVESFLSKMPGAWVERLCNRFNLPRRATCRSWHLPDRQGFEAW